MATWTVLASDFDGTMAIHGVSPPETLAAIAGFRASGGLFILVTGRRMAELEDVFPGVDDQVDRIVAENGAVLYDPAAPPPRTLPIGIPEDMGALLTAHGVGPYELGEAIVSADREDEPAVRRVAAALAARWPCQVVPNKDRVMLLPAGVDKGSGLAAAVASLGLLLTDVLAIGDGENDVPLLSAAGFGVAVADAVPGLVACADHVTAAPSAAGVVEAIAQLLAR